MRVLVAVGSHRDRVCSIGSFARAEAQALKRVFEHVELLEPTADGRYPICGGGVSPDLILFHAPSLHDRGKPWRPLLSALRLRVAYPRALFVPVVHEFSEAPRHWQLRQIAILKMSSGAIVNSEADFAGLKPYGRHLARAHLGPTLFIEELLEACAGQEIEARVQTLRKTARATIARDFKALDPGAKWLLHPGLLTPGKGINALAKLKSVVSQGVTLIIMGGMGPKEADREFARTTLAALERDLAGRVLLVDSPDDERFKSFLLAADLVVLPYDAGVSERRSSFLSAMCCGANVWTTTGRFSAPLGLDRSGAWQVSADVWNAGAGEATREVAAALAEPEAEATRRRARNLTWAAERSWSARVDKVMKFISSLR